MGETCRCTLITCLIYRGGVTMIERRTVGWWYWLATLVLLAASFLVWYQAIYLAIILCVVQIVHFAMREISFQAFPVQLRIAYFMFLICGLWGPLRFIHALQILGTAGVILTGYCFLARALALLPWNRKEPLTGAFVKRTIFSMPVEGSILDGPKESPGGE
ncbi:hypothetical protein LCGC14_2434080 [marine sediment metagenome]|uniref:DUF4395 domain-containing protein n=1 Tax=marine sediment metagenome TaxID=412755 RepID=A0A0F9DY01_9ZZZZ